MAAIWHRFKCFDASKHDLRQIYLAFSNASE
jgi:hypothetical protein